MSQPYTGGCACGAIRYEIRVEPVVTNDCQCRDCQRESGTGHGSHLTFARAGVKVEGKATGGRRGEGAEAQVPWEDAVEAVAPPSSAVFSGSRQRTTTVVPCGDVSMLASPPIS